MVPMTQTAAEPGTTDVQGEEVSDAVIAAVADATGEDPIELEPLYSVVDPDALNSLFRGSTDASATTMELRFSMAGCRVVVRGDGDVDVTPPEDDDHPTGIPSSDR